MPRIIELSFVAVTRDNICLEKNEIPRVLQTLTVPVNPNTTIPLEVENLTELKNECLQNVSSFNDKIYNLINNFLDTLMVPICFVAHNGYRFDYPIFLWELKCLHKDLASSILCVDTLSLFKDFFMNTDKTIIQDSKAINILNSPISSKNENLETSLVEEETRKDQTKQREFNIEVLSNRKENHTYQRPINFKLTTIYEHLLNVPAEKAHTAQGDCINMLRCANHIGEFFLEWCDHHAVPLIEKRKN
ncbi:hypothetical protein KPH14_008337 [Odynerus spinipes]|uniref:Exonuclease domain-containing protein n=1 Tax=Odynerus spinipes TaxID=1348599 RepID=A0AAD9R915_9HYME|nr:hypothetical protein KPH14_008337 [Odynerus spinipes]